MALNPQTDGRELFFTKKLQAVLLLHNFKNYVNELWTTAKINT